jgi:hypothetical protein
LFENTAIKDFASKLQLTMNNLFSDKVTGTNNPYGSANLNTVVLNGTYQDHNGTPVYVFDNKDDNLFFFDSNLLTNVEITKIQFNTLLPILQRLIYNPGLPCGATSILVQ